MNKGTVLSNWPSCRCGFFKCKNSFHFKRINDKKCRWFYFVFRGSSTLRGRQSSYHCDGFLEGLVRGEEVIDTGKAIAMPVGGIKKDCSM